MAERALAAAEVQTLSDSGRLCLIIHGKVYDVSEFAAEHPGGETVLLERSGSDATEAFEDVAHSGDARDLMQQYYIGELDTTVSSSEKPPVKANPSCSSSSRRWMWIPPAGAVAVAVAVAVAWRFFRRT